MIPAFPVYLFDVDGTLVDSAADICGAIRDVLAKTDRNDVDDSYLRKFIGHHLIDLFVDLFPGMAVGEIDHLVCEYRAIYPARQHSETRLYPGAMEAIQTLGGRKSTATTKGTPTTRIVLEKFGLLPYFDHVQGTDGFPAKPAPDVILASLKALRVKPEDCLLVGDAAPDMEAGRRAGVKICAVTYGYGDREAMARFEPDYWIDDLRELCAPGAPIQDAKTRLHYSPSA
ncbi:MAG TPA: HAD-IA family hydrolase [Bryobacteraceae bacterium]|nr:HAD-IA family hydrolase [Bryobacteraceae bacterium]